MGTKHNLLSGALSVLVFAVLSIATAAHAEDPPPEDAAPQPIYLPLKPSFVVNYGGDGRLRYIKADITARLSASETATAVRHHLPYIRNNIVRLLGSQTDETIESQAGKDALRKDILKEIRWVVQEEEGLEGVDDVFFDSLIVQK